MVQNGQKSIDFKRFKGGKFTSSNKILNKKTRNETNLINGNINKCVYNLLIIEFKNELKEQIVKENKTRYTFKVHLRMISSAG